MSLLFWVKRCYQDVDADLDAFVVRCDQVGEHGVELHACVFDEVSADDFERLREPRDGVLLKAARLEGFSLELVGDELGKAVVLLRSHLLRG